MWGGVRAQDELVQQRLQLRLRDLRPRALPHVRARRLRPRDPPPDLLPGLPRVRQGAAAEPGMPQEGSGRGAPRGAPGEAPGHEVLGLRREGAAEGRGLALEARDEAPEAVRGGGGEGVLAGQQVEQGHPETPDVRGR